MNMIEKKTKNPWIQSTLKYKKVPLMKPCQQIYEILKSVSQFRSNCLNVISVSNQFVNQISHNIRFS